MDLLVSQLYESQVLSQYLKCLKIINGTIFSRRLTGLKHYFITLKFKAMLRWTVIFLIIAIAAAVLGFTGIASGAASIARILFFIFIVLFLISLISGKSLKKSGV